MTDAPDVNKRDILDQKYITLVTYDEDGTECLTPSFFVADGARMLVVSRASVGLQNRVAQYGAVTVTPCTQRGQACGPTASGRARVLDPHDAARARDRLVARYGLVARAITSDHGTPAADLVGIEIELAA